MEKTKTTNHILGERIKLFEAANNQDIYEKYFPTKTTNTVNESSCHGQTCPPPQQHHCCFQPPPCLYHNCHPPSNAAAHSDDLKNVVQELSKKVAQLSNDTITLKCEVREAVKNMVLNPISDVPSSVTSPTNHLPLSPEVIVVEQDQYEDQSGSGQAEQANVQAGNEQSDRTDHAECSDNTIDDNVPDDTARNSLNCNVLTTQLI